MFTPIIGLEIHLQLKTKSKVFCSCSTAETAEPNTNICPICLAYPGAMPNLNKEAVLQAIRMGFALNSKIANETNWDRKNYMYPDLFKGYQITQLDQPICGEGEIEVLIRDRKNFYSKDNYKKTFGIFRAHLEEDTAKSLHGQSDSKSEQAQDLPLQGEFTLLDANKAGIPLLEIVSKPEMYSVDEAVSYAKAIRNLARWFDISDCNMEMGQMRFDANISVQVKGNEVRGKRYEEWGEIEFTPIVEIKNLNSFGNLEAALLYEIERQIEEYKKSGEVYSAGSKETRGWNDETQKTYTQRKKEEANEYRYIPEPDIPELRITDEELRIIREEMPVSPSKVLGDLVTSGVAEQAARVITEDRFTFEVYRKVVGEEVAIASKVANLLTNELGSELNGLDPTSLQTSLKLRPAGKLGGTIEGWALGLRAALIAVEKGEISSTEIKDILKNHKKGEADFENLLQNAKSSEKVDVESVLKKAMADNPGVVQQIKDGKDSAKMFFVGIVMRETKGKASPEEVKGLIDKLIN
jgi:aspartyl-tRNA(Asn)/glutamyl-tRNA(Gln) amidotransferase subunit B